jgi:hypothetical protein
MDITAEDMILLIKGINVKEDLNKEPEIKLVL